MDQFPFEFETSGITFTEVDWEYRWLNDGVIRDKQQAQPFDDEGVGVRNINGHYYMHPVNLAAFGLTRLDMYNLNDDEEYLELVVRQAERLIARAIPRDDALYFPYTFPWNLNNHVASPMPVPWYSGMAQAYALALFSRLYELGGEERYLEYAHKVFNSYLQPRADNVPWFVDFVDEKYIWFEEYAHPELPPGSATNGHVYACICLHDYWKITGDERAQTLADGGLTSVLAHMDLWRRPGGISYYGLTGPKGTATYHHWHAKQLGQVFDVTGDPIWIRFQDLFMQDYPTQFQAVEPNNATLIVKPGEYEVGERGDLTVTEHVRVVIEEEQHLQIDTRARRYGEMEFSTRVKDEGFLYMWFTEVPHEVYVSGMAETAFWGHPVEHRVLAEIDRLVEFDDLGEKTGEIDQAFSVGDTVTIRGRGLIKGEVWMQLWDEQFSNAWIPQSSLELIYT